VNEALDFIVNPSTAPRFPLLNTSDWALLIPPIAKLYPDQSMQFEFIAINPPTFAFVSGQAGAVASAQFNWNLSVSANDSLTYLCTMLIDANGSLDISASMKGSNATLFASMSSLNLNLSVADSNVGPIDPIVLETIAKDIGPAIAAAVNVIGAIGLPLPTLDGVSLVNPHVLYNDGYITISSDFSYSPPKTILTGDFQCMAISTKSPLGESRRVCVQVNEGSHDGKTVFWAIVQDTLTGAVAVGDESDSSESASYVALKSLFEMLRL